MGRFCEYVSNICSCLALQLSILVGLLIKKKKEKICVRFIFMQIFAEFYWIKLFYAEYFYFKVLLLFKECVKPFFGWKVIYIPFMVWS